MLCVLCYFIPLQFEFTIEKKPNMKTISKFVVILYIFNYSILNLNTAEYSTSNNITFAEVLNKYQQYIKKMEYCSFSFHDTIEDKNIKSPVGMFKSASSNYSYFINKESKNGDFLESVEKNYFNGRRIHIVKSSKMNLPNGIVFKTNTILPITNFSKSTEEKELDKFKSELPFSILYGYIPVSFTQNEKIWNVIKKGDFHFQVLQKNDTVEVLYEGKVDNIQFKFCFASQYGYALTKAFFVNESSSINSGYKSLQIELNDFNSYNGTDFFFPNKYNMTYVATTTSQQQDERGKVIEVPYTQQGNILYEFSNFKINDEHVEKEFPLMSKIDNGTDVIVSDALQIQYVWLDGEIVPKTDEVALRIARGDHKFMPGPKEPRFWFIALGIIMLLLGGGMKLRDMLKES
jgi:hypothetical protein